MANDIILVRNKEKDLIKMENEWKRYSLEKKRLDFQHRLADNRELYLERLHNMAMNDDKDALKILITLSCTDKITKSGDYVVIDNMPVIKNIKDTVKAYQVIHKRLCDGLISLESAKDHMTIIELAVNILIKISSEEEKSKYLPIIETIENEIKIRNESH